MCSFIDKCEAVYASRKTTENQEKDLSFIYKSMKAAQMPDSNTCMVSIDLQQVLFVPTLVHNQVFYSRQLSTDNFNIHVSDSERVFMCL